MMKTPRRAGGKSLPPMSMDEAHRVMREIGEAHNPDDPRYAQVKARVVDAIYRTLPGVNLKTIERATGIYNVFRTRPALIPGPLPSSSSNV